jgi:acetyl esterase/lipase
MKLSALLPVFLLLVGPLEAQVAAPTPTKIALWPEGVPGFRPDAPKEVDTPTHVEFVDSPSVTVFPADPAKANGTAVVVCPGGGYVRLAIQKEGTRIAEWLNSIGVSAFVLRYRMKEYGYPAPQQDVLRAIRLVRSRAAEFHVDPARIGVLGASAGGHLSASAGTLYDTADGRTGNALDSVSARPDFLILLYPVITMKAPLAHEGSVHALLGKNPTAEQREAMSLETRVTKRTPPAFLVQAEDDKTVPVENSILFYQALHQAGVPAELHLYPKGGHGFGIPSGFGPLDDWRKRCEEWMRQNGWLAATFR